MSKKLNEQTKNMFEDLMKACQESKRKKKSSDSKALNESLKKSRKSLKESDEYEDDFDGIDIDIDDTEYDYDGNPIEDSDKELPEDTFDDVAIIVDPEMDPEDTSALSDIQKIIDDTPEGEVPTSDEYIGDKAYTCPICGNKFFSDKEMSEGDECPVCGDTPDGFVFIGEVSEINESAEEKPEDTEDTSDEEVDVDVEETEDDTEEVEESLENRRASRQRRIQMDESNLIDDVTAVRTPPKRSSNRPRVKAPSTTKLGERRRPIRRTRRVAERRLPARTRTIERRVSRPMPSRRVAERRIPRRNLRRTIERRIPRRNLRRTIERRIPRRNLRRTVERTFRFDEINERTFNSLLNKFLRENYRNAKFARITKATLTKDNKLRLEGRITYINGKSSNLKLVSETLNLNSRLSNIKFNVVSNNFNISEGFRKNAPITFECSLSKGSMSARKISYNFVTESNSKKYRVYGKHSLTERKRNLNKSKYMRESVGIPLGNLDLSDVDQVKISSIDGDGIIENPKLRVTSGGEVLEVSGGYFYPEGSDEGTDLSYDGMYFESEYWIFDLHHGILCIDEK